MRRLITRHPAVGRLAPLALVAGLVVPVGVGAPMPAYAADKTGCDVREPADNTTATDVDEGDDEDNPSLRALRLDDTHDLATGKGVGVAVIDSGVQASDLLTPVTGTSFVGDGAIKNGHGTIVAGLIGGHGQTTSMAPDSVVVSVRVSSSEPDDDDPQPASVDPDNVAKAIQWVVDHPDTGGARIRVINLSLGFPPGDDYPAIKDALAAAEKAGIVVVAAAGNRPPKSDDEPDESESPAEDKPDTMPDEVLFPATLDTVLAVTGRAEDLAMTTEAVLVGPEVDVSAPVVGLRSVMLRGILCDVPVTASSWATASVSGLAALVLERFPDLTPAQVRTRIEMTASGGFRDSATDGHGMIQPRAALTTVLDTDKHGELRDSRGNAREKYVAPKPQVPGDEYADSRKRLLWWGVGAGGAVLLALILRPLTARRRD